MASINILKEQQVKKQLHVPYVSTLTFTLTATVIFPPYCMIIISLEILNTLIVIKPTDLTYGVYI